MPRRRLVAVSVAGTVCGIGYSAWKRRRNRQGERLATVTHVTVKRQGLIRPLLIYLFASSTLTPTYIEWNFVDKAALWFGRISGLAGAVLGIIGFITDPIVDLVKGVWDAVLDAVNGVAQLVGALEYRFQQLANLASWLEGQFRYYFNEWFDPLFEAAFGPFRRIIENVSGYLDVIWDQIYDFVTNTVADFVEAALRLALGGIVDLIAEIKKFLDDPIGYIWDLLSDLVNGLIDMAIEFLAETAGFCAKVVSLGLKTLLDVKEDVIHTLKEAWSFLVWIAAHPEEAIMTLIQDAIHELIANNFSAMQETVNDAVGGIEDLVSGMLGIDL